VHHTVNSKAATEMRHTCADCSKHRTAWRRNSVPVLKAKQSKVKLGEGCSLYSHRIFKQKNVQIHKAQHRASAVHHPAYLFPIPAWSFIVVLLYRSTQNPRNIRPHPPLSPTTMSTSPYRLQRPTSQPVTLVYTVSVKL